MHLEPGVGPAYIRRQDCLRAASSSSCNTTDSRSLCKESTQAVRRIHACALASRVRLSLYVTHRYASSCSPLAVQEAHCTLSVLWGRRHAHVSWATTHAASKFSHLVSDATWVTLLARGS